MVAGNLAGLTDRTKDEAFAAVCACQINGHAIVDASGGQAPGLDAEGGLDGVALGRCVSEALARFDHSSAGPRPFCGAGGDGAATIDASR